MLKKSFYIFVFLFFLSINFSVTEIKIDFFERVIYISFFISLFILFRSINLDRALILLTPVVSVLIFTYGIIQKYILFPIYLNSMNSGISTFSKAIKSRIAGGRVFSIFALPTLYTLICAILLLAIFHYFLNSKTTFKKILWSIIFLMGVFNIVLTQSFSGVLYLLSGFPVYLILSGKSKVKFMLPLMMILSVFLFIIVGLRFSEAKKLEPIKLRISNWTQAIRIIKSSPYLGIGLGNYPSVVPKFTLEGEAKSIYAHNFFLQITAEGGIPILLFLSFLLILFRKKLKPILYRENALFSSILLVIILYNLIDIGLYFFSASLLFTIIISQLYRDENPPKKSAVVLVIILLLIQSLAFYSSGLRKTGSFHFNFKRFDKAKRYFRKSLAINKFNYNATLGLAKTTYAKNNFNESEKMLKRVIKMNGFIPYSHFLISRIYYIKKEYISSFYHAAKANSLNSKNRNYNKWYKFLKNNLERNLKGTQWEQKHG